MVAKLIQMFHDLAGGEIFKEIRRANVYRERKPKN